MSSITIIDGHLDHIEEMVNDAIDKAVSKVKEIRFFFNDNQTLGIAVIIWE